MALYYDLPVYKDVYRLILRVFEYTKDFPRRYKYALGQDLRRGRVVMVRSIYLKILPMKKQAEPAVLMDGIGKQVAGWRSAGL